MSGTAAGSQNRKMNKVPSSHPGVPIPAKEADAAKAIGLGITRVLCACAQGLLGHLASPEALSTPSQGNDAGMGEGPGA